jgi:beta-1,4-mannosyltransferase
MLSLPSAATVVVLGDLGRSPRTMYHALALADAGVEVDLVAYAGSEPLERIARHPRIRPRYLREPAVRRRRSGAAYLAAAFARVLWQAAQLFATLARSVRRPDVLVVQTPPALPTLLVGLLCARLRGAQLLIDWHNLGYTLVALALGGSHPAVRLARCCERLLARRGDAHLCVSRALQTALAREWGVHAAVLYDRPGEQFVPIPEEARPPTLQRLSSAWNVPLDGRRPAVIVTATSWTADEDFDVLLDAAARLDASIRQPGAESFPDLLVLITGRGALRDHYEARFRGLDLQRVRVRALWLPPEEYPHLLACADLGLCLHRSSSGLDLPMKVADMLGTGLPFCALDYGPCLREVVRDGANGLLFSDAAELAEQVLRLFDGFPNDNPLLARLRAGATADGRQRWRDSWQSAAAPLFHGMVRGPSPAC